MSTTSLTFVLHHFYSYLNHPVYAVRPVYFADNWPSGWMPNYISVPCICKLKDSKGEPHLKCTIYQLIVSVNLLQLFGHLQGPIWASVVNNDDLVAISTVKINMKSKFTELTQGQKLSWAQSWTSSDEDSSPEV